MRYIFCLIIILLFILPVNATSSISSENPNNIDELIFAGLDNMYNLKFELARSNFQKAKSNFPNDIKGYFYESMIDFHSAIAKREEETYENYINRSDKVIEKCDVILDENENNIEALFYKGQTLSYRSLLLLSLNKSLLSAASDGNSGYRILSDVIAKNPNFYDAYMGLGLYKIAIGFVPEKFQWLLSLIGFDGDIKSGRNLLFESKKYGKFTKVESQVYLALFSLREVEEDNGNTERMLKELVDQYPQSPLFRLFYSNILQQMGKTEEAINQAKQSLELNTNSLQDEIKKGANFVLGMSYFRKNDFENAIKHFEEHLKYVKKEDRYNISTFHLGVAYGMTGNREKAIENYKKSRADFIDERDGEAEKLFLKYSKKLINIPLSDFDKKLLTGMNYRYSFNTAEALNIFNGILISDKLPSMSDDDKVRLYMETGHAYTYEKKDDLAIDYFTRATKLKPNDERWMIPHAYFELGKIYTRKGNSKKAEEMFEKIYEYGDYDLRLFLEMRLKSYREN